MGILSRRCLPICAEILCLPCPGMRAASRKPKKRYKMYLTEIFAKADVSDRQCISLSLGPPNAQALFSASLEVTDMHSCVSLMTSFRKGSSMRSKLANSPTMPPRIPAVFRKSQESLRRRLSETSRQEDTSACLLSAAHTASCWVPAAHQCAWCTWRLER